MEEQPMILSLQTLQKTLIAGIATSLLSLAAILWPVTLPAPLVFAPDAAATISTSHNWSGYTATNATFTSVSGMWTIPSASSSGHAAADAAWVGIGGIRRNDLVQAGTQNIIGSSGQISTTAFIEMLPRASQHIPMTVNPGDSVTVAVAQQSTDQWQFSFVDNTNGQTYVTTLAYHSSLSSAEWIEEDPSSRARLLPLDNFGTVQFSSGSAIQNGNSVNIAQANGQAMTMLDANCQALATPSALGGDGASFTITRSSVDTTPPVSDPEGSERGWRRDGNGIGQYPGGNQNCFVAPISVPNPATPPVWVPRPSQNFWGRWFRFFGR
jgi:hypothetical protein